MTPQEMKQLAELLQNVPGIKSIELEDVQGLAQLLRDTPEIGSIEVKGLFGTKVVITRTGTGVAAVHDRAGRVPRAVGPAPRRAERAAAAGRRARPAGGRCSRTSSPRWWARSTSRPSRARTPTSRWGPA